MNPTTITIDLKKGQRWKWTGGGDAIVEVLEDATIMVDEHNAVRCRVVQCLGQDRWRALGESSTWTFGDCLDRWEHLEGQDASK